MMVPTSQRRSPASLLSEIDLDGVLRLIEVPLHKFMILLSYYYRQDSRLEDLVKYYNGLSETRKARATLYSICKANSFPNNEMFSIISGMCFDLGTEKAKLLVSLNIPAIVEASIKNALGEGPLSQQERIEWLRYLVYWGGLK